MTTDREKPPTRRRPRSRDAANWAKPVDRLSAEGVAGAEVDSVTGKRVSGPLQGFGQLWQKTFTRPARGLVDDPAGGHRRLEAALRDVLAEDGPVLRAAGRDRCRARSRCSTSPRCPGAPVKLSTGVMVIYADDESFTFMTPEGHTLSAWITFSAYRDGDVTIAQVQALERTSDPLDELAYMLGGNRMNDRVLARDARERGAGHGRDGPGRGRRGRVHRQAPSVAPRRQHPQQRHASDDAPHADGPRPLDHAPRVTARISSPRPLRLSPTVSTIWLPR